MFFLSRKQATKRLMHPHYRPDIDGLRAVAILSVVMFHGFPEWVKGGFIGVDIFFVISGFLISTILLNGASKDVPNLVEFYSRRVLRIFPALLLVLAANLILGWLFLLVDEYAQLGKHVVGGAGFVSNFILWHESGYFDAATYNKPLLHLWSLGVEEQFYIIWPAVIWLMRRKRFNILSLTLIVMTMSFAFNIHQVKSDAIAAFYSPLTRFWELMLGGGLAHLALYEKDCGAAFRKKLNFWLETIIYIQPSKSENKTLCDVLSACGAICIVVGLLLITKDRHFPGWWAVLPTMGSLLIIAAGAEAWVNRTILSSRILVWFGLISFPLYLWHWSLFSFARIIGLDMSPLNCAAIIMISIVFAWLTYVSVEKPIRFGQHKRAKTIILILLMALIGGIGCFCYQDGGVVFRAFPEQAKTLASYNSYNDEKEKDVWSGNSCFLLSADAFIRFQQEDCLQKPYPDKPVVFLIGDSHAAYLSQGLKAFFRDKPYNFSEFTAAYCTTLSLNDTEERCREINSYVMDRIREEKPDIIIFFANHLLRADDPEYGEKIPYDDYLVDKMKDMKDMGVKKIILIGQIPTWRDSLPRWLARTFILRGKPIPLRTYNGVWPIALQWDRKLRNKPYPDNVTYISLRDFLCNDEGCLTSIGPDLANDLIVYDYSHLTRSGAAYITKNLLVGPITALLPKIENK